MSFDSPFLSSLWWPRAKAAGVETLGKGCSLPAPAREASWAGRGRPSVVRSPVLSVFVPFSVSLRQWGTFGTAKAAPAQRRRLVCGLEERPTRRGKAWGAKARRCPRRVTRAATLREPEGALPCCQGRWEGGVRGAFYFPAGARSWPGAAAILWRGRHFAEPRGQGGGGGARAAAACGVGGRGWRAGLAEAPGQPRSRKGERVPFVLRLWALGRRRPGAALSARGVCPRPAAEGRAHSPKSLLASEPVQVGARHPHPRSGKGVHFIWPCPERHRGKP